MGRNLRVYHNLPHCGPATPYSLVLEQRGVSEILLVENYAIVPACIFGFIAAHAVGQGTVIWVFISEIFPNRHRAQGQSLGSFTHWIFAALLTLFFPSMVERFPPGVVFGFFCFMMILQLVWVKLMVPETKGRPLEAIEHELGVG